VADGARAITRERNDKTGMKEDTTKGIIAGKAIELAGGAVGFRMEYNAIQDRAKGNAAAINKYTDTTNENQRLYAKIMGGANETRLAGVTNAADKGAEIASKGARDAYGISVGGYNQAYNLGMRGNEIGYKGTLKGAGEVRDAAVQAARLREASSIINSVGHNIARNMEQGLILRY
jgi:hypothetical protein